MTQEMTESRLHSIYRCSVVSLLCFCSRSLFCVISLEAADESGRSTTFKEPLGRTSNPLRAKNIRREDLHPVLAHSAIKGLNTCHPRRVARRHNSDFRHADFPLLLDVAEHLLPGLDDLGVADQEAFARVATLNVRRLTGGGKSQKSEP